MKCFKNCARTIISFLTLLKARILEPSLLIFYIQMICHYYIIYPNSNGLFYGKYGVFSNANKYKMFLISDLPRSIQHSVLMPLFIHLLKTLNYCLKQKLELLFTLSNLSLSLFLSLSLSLSLSLLNQYYNYHFSEIGMYATFYLSITVIVVGIEHRDTSSN